MLWIPNKGSLLVQSNAGSIGTLSPGTSVTTGGSSNTKGTPSEIFSSTDFDAYWVSIQANGYSGGNGTQSQGCLDILIGASTEEVLIANLLMGYCAASDNYGKRWDFPLYIPAGSRISAQAAGIRTSANVQVIVSLYGGHGYPPFRVGGRVDTYGVSSVPDGTAITPGVSSAEGDWAEITASTSRDHFALLPSFQMTGDTSTNNRFFAVDIGIGDVTEEQIAESFWFGTNAAEAMLGPVNSFPVFQDIPSGTRLVMRASNIGTNDGGYNGAIHAVS